MEIAVNSIGHSHLSHNQYIHVVCMLHNGDNSSVNPPTTCSVA